MNFIHGISSVTGKYYEKPLVYRTEPSIQRKKRGCCFQINMIQGYCDKCEEWVDITYENNKSSDGQIRLTNWYRHAKKCSA